LRKAKGFTQETLSEKAGLHPTYIGAIERGECNVSIKTLEKVCVALEVDIPEFFRLSFPEAGLIEAEMLLQDINLLIKAQDKPTLKLASNLLREIIEWKRAYLSESH